uniref:Phytanoyl-CoA 2-hydroxylase n=1 Tax=Stegastes partitus TaxID=144197 RepID=A0A3B5AVY5_9TELE
MSRAADRLRLLINHLDRSPATITAEPTSTQTFTYSHPQRLRYSFDTDLLTPEDRLFYEENGFLLVKNLVSEEDIDRFRIRGAQ